MSSGPPSTRCSARRLPGGSGAFGGPNRRPLLGKRRRHPRDAPPPAARPVGAPVRRGLDLARRNELRLPAAGRRARGRVRRRDVLRDVLRVAAAAVDRARLRRHRVPPGGRAGDRRGAREPARAGRRRLAPVAVPRPLRARPRGSVPALGTGREDSAAAPCDAATIVAGLDETLLRILDSRLSTLNFLRLPFRSPDPGLPPRLPPAPLPRRPRRPDEPRRVPRPRRIRGAPRRLRARPRRCPARDARVEADGARRRRLPRGPQVGGGRAAAVRPHYIVCNADESEPGTFKDRVLMEEDPFALVESMTIVAFATGCERGFVYVRGEYPLAIERVAGARRGGPRARDSSARAFSAGRSRSTSRCAAAPARTSAARRRRSSTRSRDSAASRATSRPSRSSPASSTSRPSSTTSRRSATRRSIVLRGGAAYASIGTPQSTGPKLFCLSGPRRAARRLRGSVRRHAAPAPRRGRRNVARRGAPRGAARRRGGLVRRAGGARRAPDVRGHARDRGRARLGRGHGLRRARRPRGYRAPHRGLLPRRVLRPVRPVPRRHGAAGGAGDPHRGRAAARLDGAGDRAARRDGARDARRVDLRARPDGVRRDPVRDLEDRRLRRSRRRERAAPGARRRSRARPGRADHRRAPGRRAGGVDDPGRLPRPGDRHADALLPRQPDARQRLPRLRRRARGIARPRAGVLAQGRAEDGDPDRQRARPAVAEDGARVPRLVRRPVARVERGPRLDGALRRGPVALRRARSVARRAATRRCPDTTTSRSRARRRPSPSP